MARYVAEWTPETTPCGCTYQGTRHVHGVPTYKRVGDFDATGIFAEIDTDVGAW